MPRQKVLRNVSLNTKHRAHHDKNVLRRITGSATVVGDHNKFQSLFLHARDSSRGFGRQESVRPCPFGTRKLILLYLETNARSSRPVLRNAPGALRLPEKVLITPLRVSGLTAVYQDFCLKLETRQSLRLDQYLTAAKCRLSFVRSAKSRTPPKQPYS